MSDDSDGVDNRDTHEITVLFVDEDRDFLDLASRLLELETDRIDLVLESSPEAALDRLREPDVDCVVSDYRMAEMDGLELLERVRSEHPRLPFILFTGRGGEEIASEAISAGATDYIVKTGSPDQYTVLANRIEKAVTRTRAQARTTQQEHLNAVVRTITNEVIHQTTREQIEQTVCENLTDIEPYAFVQISRPTAEDVAVRPRAWAVTDTTDTDPDAIEEVVGSGIQSPERAAHETGNPLVIDDIHGEARFEQWQSSIGSTDLTAVACLPIVYADISYGVVSIYATAPGAFSDIEPAIFGWFGKLIGFAISSAELRQGMLSSTMTEIELTFQNSSAGLIRLAQELQTGVTLETIVPRSDGNFSMSLAVEDPSTDRDQTAEAITELLRPEEATLSTTEDGIQRWAVVMDTPQLGLFEGRGIRMNYLTATEESGQISLAVPPNIDVSDVVAIAESQFENVELTERRTHDGQRSVSTHDGIVEDLTPRQREVLETAHRHGFFEWPRQMNTEEVAALLDMSQPALSRHLRNIQHTIADSIVDELTDSPATD